MEMRSWGSNDPESQDNGYLKLNKQIISNNTLRGITVTKFTSLSPCVVEDPRRFDMYYDISEGHRLRDWLDSQEEGSVVIGVSADDAYTYMSPAVAVFSALGVDVSRLSYRWRFGFVLRVGSPDLSRVLLESEGDPALLTVTIRK